MLSAWEPLLPGSLLDLCSSSPLNVPVLRQDPQCGGGVVVVVCGQGVCVWVCSLVMLRRKGVYQVSQGTGEPTAG